MIGRVAVSVKFIIIRRVIKQAITSVGCVEVGCFEICFRHERGRSGRGRRCGRRR